MSECEKMDFNSYFGSLLKSGFSFLNVSHADDASNSDVTRHYISNSDNISVEFQDENALLERPALYAESDTGGVLATQSISNIIAVLKGNENASVRLIDTINVKIQTGNGDDFIELTDVHKEAAIIANEIFVGNGENLVSLSSNAQGFAKFHIVSGNGNDRLISSGYSHDFIITGAGKDMIMSGRGRDYIDAQDGWDKVLFEGPLEDYQIELLDNQEVMITSKEDENSEAKLVNVEELVFSDQSYIFPYQELVQLDGFDQFFDYFSAYQTSNISWNSSYETNDWVYSEFITTDNENDLISFYIDDWTEETDTANVIVDQVSAYDAQHSDAQYEEIDFIDIDTTTQEQLRAFIEDSIPFDLMSAIREKHAHGHNPLKLLGTGKDDFLLGGDFNDHLFGGAGHDILIGGRGDDMFIGDTGNDVILGGEGIDSAFFLGMSSDFSFDVERGIMTDRNGEHGIDFLKSVERLIFLDAVYKVTNDFRVELMDENPFEVLEASHREPGLEIIGLPPRPPKEFVEKLEAEGVTPPPPQTATEIEEHLMKAYESVVSHFENNQTPGVDI